MSNSGMTLRNPMAWISRLWCDWYHPPRMDVIDLASMDDAALVRFYGTNFPGRFSRSEIEIGNPTRRINWSSVAVDDLANLKGEE